MAVVGVSIRILRNLGILKSLLFNPILSDQYNAGPFDVSRTANAINRQGIIRTMAAISVNKMSMWRFIISMSRVGGLSR